MNLNEFLQKENCAKEFNICVGNIKVSNERNLYNALENGIKALQNQHKTRLMRVINPIITVRTLFLKQKMILKAVWQLLLKI